MTVPFSSLPGGKQSRWFPNGGTTAWQLPHSIHTSAYAKRCKLHLLELPPRGGCLNGGQALCAQLPFEQLLSWKATCIQGQSSTPAPQRVALGHLGPRGNDTAPAFAVMGTCQSHSGCTRRNHSLSHLGNRLGEEWPERNWNNLGLNTD